MNSKARLERLTKSKVGEVVFTVIVPDDWPIPEGSTNVFHAKDAPPRKPGTKVYAV